MEWLLQARPLLLRIAMLSVTLAMLWTPGLAVAQSDPPPNITGPEIKILIRTTFIAVHHANISGNYTVLRDIGTRSFREMHNTADLGDIFETFRKEKIDLSSTVLVDPILTKSPRVSEEGELNVVGFFPAEPYQILFDIVFVNEKKAWKMAKISIGTK